MKEEFESTQVDQKNMLAETKGNYEVLQLKNNCIPKVLIPPENIFAQNDVFKYHITQDDDEEVETCNIGTVSVPKMIKLSRFLSVEMKQKYIEMMRKFSDAFAWSYVDLNKCDPIIIQHTIPIKENEKPFKLKLRRNNPLLMPLIEKEIKKIFDEKIIVPI